MTDHPDRPDRTPTETQPATLDPLTRLPLFFGLRGRRVVLAGGSDGAAWRAELLSAAGAEVSVFAAAPGERLRAIAAAPPDGPITLMARGWRAADLAGAALAVGAIAGEAECAAFAAAARAAGVPVDVIERPALCDFTFGALVNRSPLVVAISTDGAAPVLAQAVRAKIEAILPASLAAWARAAAAWRPAVQALGLSFARRRRFWERFARAALDRPQALPDAAERDRLLAESAAEGAAAETGSVVLVGAGPGDPELLTLKAVRALQSADVVLYDDLVSPAVLDLARREARKIHVGKRGYGPSCRQSDINDLAVALAAEGNRVVRLKAGDPLVFGRAGEEMAACRRAGIPVEIVPGITAAQGAAAALGVSLTHRDHAQRLQFVTAHDRHGGLPASIDWASLADPAVTTVVYMPGRTLPELAARAIAHGLDPATPAVAMANASRPDQLVMRSTVAGIADAVAAAAPNGPLLVLIGRALEAAPEPGDPE